MECSCGHQKIEKISKLGINHKKILESGFKRLQESILYEGISSAKCKSGTCDLLSPSVELKYNNHIIIDTEVSQNQETFISCKVQDFPVYLTLLKETYRHNTILKTF